MLDQNTKRKIDNTRNILVGKIPDPKAQVEQITIALVYKFMDDMDKESEELGGKARFFSNGFSQFSWSKLLDQKLSGQERFNLYVQAISSMSNNQNIPQLFRDIFKGAFLPYNDPRTLSLFLKEINEFSYEHSEDLGDSFEYLLSVLGSQGDAGQFRTPRHIIDFIVEAVDPKKNEKILDPACGTAGFLISAYKHILKQNKSKPLTPDEKQRLMLNLAGYDISPDMVKLALVNMYLHGFPEPKIYEYDTLSDERRWDEYADVILANPPFMTPKGGIQPHKRFSVPSNRSEVLFVDYIAEHLSQNGRAGIIVPEGIIFQSAGAYKQLRKYLIENNYLWAVVSLPAGIFNPYSGVKTSILLLDKTIAKKTDNVLFVKIENDGLDLGAQRREIDQNDLPEALHILLQYKESIGSKAEFKNDNKNVLVVKTKIIGEKDDYNLSIDRYRENVDDRKSEHDFKRLGDICEIKKGSSITKKDTSKGNIPVIAGGQQPAYYHNEANRTGEVITVSSSGAYAGFVNYFNEPIFASDCTTIQTQENLNCRFLFFLLKSHQEYFYSLQKGGAQPHVYGKDFSELKIPIPPLETQKQIVSKIEGWQKIIGGARQVIENYKPHIEIQDEWEMVELGSVCEVNPKKSEIKELHQDTLVSFVPMADINENSMNFIPKEKRKLSEVVGSYTYFIDNDVVVAKVTPCFENGKAGIANNLENGIGFGSSELYILRCSKNVMPVWIYLQIVSDKFRALGKEQMTGTGGLQRVPKDFVSSFEIPLPTLLKQQELVNQINEEQQIIAYNKKLILLYEQKIKDEINRLWTK